MKKPDIEILLEGAEGLYNGVYVNGEIICLCHNDSQSDAIREMLNALIEVCDHIDMHSCNLPASAKNKTRQALKKAGCTE